ncbi:MAG TPA: SpoIIE family protein phosphatase [Candidatus Acidoferrales bacterium]|nr:SpoIIE family protein phosphatase [Candidatus Acidoferrales bacterium]
MAGITDPYLREQLEKRREELRTAIAVVPAEEVRTAGAPLVELLHEVDAAVHRMDDGTYGVCEACKGTLEKDRLIADPLVQLCLDCLSVEEQRALERDLELASQIQRGLLPQADTRFGDWRIHYRYKPAGVVSGDYCDVIPPASADGKLIFLLGDVAGKGVAASLLMTHLHAMFRTLASIGFELDKLLEMANRVFCESTTAGQYATLICGRIGRDGEVEIASAGHFPALLVTKDGVKQIGSTGLPLGLFTTSRYTVRRAHLDFDDSLLLFTDGISEAGDHSGEQFGIEGLSVVAGERHGWSPQELVAACLSDVEKHCAGSRQADDQTLMAIQRAGTGAAAFND